MQPEPLEEVRAAGVLCFRCAPQAEFLLMRHPHRFDLPKGHREPGETDQQCALRELFEETGICADDIQIDPEFRLEVVYYPRYRRLNYGAVRKTVVFFLAKLIRDVDLKLTEHEGCEWVAWNPPHEIQKETVDELLAAAAEHLSKHNPGASPCES